MTITETDTWQSPFLQGLMAPVVDERDDDRGRSSGRSRRR